MLNKVGQPKKCKWLSKPLNLENSRHSNGYGNGNGNSGSNSGSNRGSNTVAATQWQLREHHQAVLLNP